MVWGFHPRFVDLNAGGHLDNVAVLRAIDEGRHRLLGVGEAGGPRLVSGLLDSTPQAVMPMVVGHHINYVRELQYAADPLEITAWVRRLGRTPFEVATEVRQGPRQEVAAIAVTAVVTVDTSTHAPWVISEDLRETLAAYAGPSPPVR